MKNLTISSILSACPGSRLVGRAAYEGEISSVTTDSRSVKPGSLFAAIVGERTDGHLYIRQAFESGAVCVLAERAPEDCAGPVIVVPSTVAALGAIAAFYRSGFDIPVIGVTGSVGKTTTKEMIASVLSQRFSVHRTAGNFNNDIGVPLTLFGLTEQHEAAVVEMGVSHFGDMARLAAMVKPTAAVFTMIADVHLEYLRDRDGVFEEKSSVLRDMAPDAPIFANGDDEHLRRLRPERPPRFYGLGINNDVRAEGLIYGPDFTRCTVAHDGESFDVVIPSYGRHLVNAALGAAAVGLSLGLTPEEIRRGIADYSPVGGRARVIDTGSIRIIDDSYNSSPTSVSSALRSLAQLKGRRVAILGDMLELGGKSEQLHRSIGALARELGIELVITVGERAADIASGAGSEALHFTGVCQAAAALPELIHPGDCVLVKASNSCGFGSIVHALEAL